MVRIDHGGVTYYIGDKNYSVIKSYIKRKGYKGVDHLLYDCSYVVIENNKLLKSYFWNNLSELIESGRSMGTIHNLPLTPFEDEFEPNFTDLVSEEPDKS
jgi:hypothetical protein